ncbi:hypothetical protein [Phenylobacterium sp.]|uniref:hypothetical protein n=1 Tax=Phenylobacterium sp. TaxID=1871053 RepID=UPI0035AECE76
MNQQRGQDQTDRPSGDAVEGSLTDGGSLPGSGGENRSFGAERDETGYGQETGPLASGDTGGASGSSGSTGASSAGEGGGGDAHLGSAGTGGTAAGDQQTAADNNQGMSSGGEPSTGPSQAGYGNGGGR